MVVGRQLGVNHCCSRNYADLMTKPWAKLKFKCLRDLCLRPESGVTGYPSMEQADLSIVEVASFFFEESWLV